MYTIIGSGFGMYGYLPALVRYLEQEVVLPIAYRPKILARSELTDCIERVRWVADRDEALHSADRMIIALPPAAQADMSELVATIDNVGTVVLEKPVAGTPEKAARVHELLLASGKRVVVNYSLLFTPWYEQLVAFLSSASPADRVKLTWQFKADHFARGLTTWKRMPGEGGGPIRFFGIHVIAVLAALGYTEVTNSRVCSSGDQAGARWSAGFARLQGPAVDVVVDTNSNEPRFALHSTVRDARRLDLELADPFIDAGHAARRPDEDRRVGVIAAMLRASRQDDDAQRFYGSVIGLWDAVERCTITD